MVRCNLGASARNADPGTPWPNSPRWPRGTVESAGDTNETYRATRRQRLRRCLCGDASRCLLPPCLCSNAPGWTRRPMLRRRTDPQTLKQHYGVTLGKKQKLAGKKFSDLTVDALIEATCRWRRSARWDHWVVWDARKKAILDPSRAPVADRWVHLKALYPVLRQKGKRSRPG